ncbi:hypothetical protein DHW03_01540 [Pedobacter yonginense]|uniref:Uncharacterized protein n=1 Tax=Pedobacter yonginense TaxID=651869 RepID=A0A317EPK7_9SPHI|nr:hypothetical protein [Pedobacter yonginense]PWS28564.1 hypothetical protein DHW03_01540 [Pedobacter yonginense]
MENTEQIAQIKVLILTKINLNSVRIDDCKYISEQIFLKTKNHLSIQTIQTIFIANRSILTPFVLNSLAQFSEFEDWEDYIKKTWEH